ncbi:MAG: hypothetical protein IJQ80_02680 [Clostridia bacterium]|nr:hypothetical protein [Clostridia bacterium]
MRLLRKIRDYLCYCGIEREEFTAIKKGAYVSNFVVWRTLHILLTVVFGFLFVDSVISPLLSSNTVFYLISFIYFVVVTVAFFFLNKESIVAQLIIYLSISFLFLLGALITQNKPELPSTTFIVMLLITPMFMIDKPFFMGI